MILIIISCILWGLSLWAVCGRQMLGPVFSFLALFLLSLAKENGFPMLPINGVILTGWLCMTLVVTFIVMLQPEAVRRQTRGTFHIMIGALAGLAVGLLGNSITASLQLRYAIMIVGVAAGVFFGFLLYTRTPKGKGVGLGSGNFFRYLLDKGFPTAITVMQAGVAAVLAMAVNN